MKTRHAKSTGASDGRKPRAPGEPDHESQQAQDRSSIAAGVVYKAILYEGQHEIKRTSSALAWSGLAAGLSMGFSLVVQGVLRTYIPNSPWQFLISKFGYSVGFLIVVLGRQQLFTENTLTAVLPFLQERNMRTFREVMRLWGVVLASNLAGAFLFSWALSGSNVFEPDIKRSFTQIGMEAISAPFGTTFLRGIFAGWLIALMVWLLPAAEAGKVHIIIIITYVIGIGHFNHIIAGSNDVFYLITSGAAGVGECLSAFAIPTVLGNVVGGVSLVAALGHAQVET